MQALTLPWLDKKYPHSHSMLNGVLGHISYILEEVKKWRRDGTCPQEDVHFENNLGIIQDPSPLQP